jgi:hypothetical protein
MFLGSFVANFTDYFSSTSEELQYSKGGAAKTDINQTTSFSIFMTSQKNQSKNDPFQAYMMDKVYYKKKTK